MSSKIEKDLKELVAAGILTTKDQDNITDYYTAKKSNQPNRLFTIFGVLGALLTGLGIILILAHNWDDFSRTTKTIWAFAPLLAGQLLTGFTIFKKKSTAWKETASVFLYIAIGASISLVSQIYHIKGEMSSFIRIWILLGLPLVYLLKSKATLLLHLIFSTIYACNFGYFNSDKPYLFLILIAVVIPFYINEIRKIPTENITGILHWLFPLSIVIALGGFIEGSDTTGFLMYVCLFGLLYNIGEIPLFETLKLRKNGYKIIASLGTIGTLLYGTFKFLWEHAENPFIMTNDFIFTSIIIIIAVVILIYTTQQKGRISFNPFQYAFIAFTGIYLLKFYGSETPTIFTNLLVLILGMYTIILGARINKYSILNYGLLIITALITCRFFDTNISFVIRGLLFISIGFGFFGANYLIYKRQTKQNIYK